MPVRNTIGHSSPLAMWIVISTTGLGPAPVVSAGARQRDPLEERIDRDLRVGPLLVIEVRRRGHQLGQVVEPVAGLGARIAFELGSQAAPIDDLDDRLGDRSAPRDDIAEPVEQLDERVQLLARTGTDTGDVAARREPCRIEQPAAVRARRRTQPVDRRVADAARRHVDDALERRVRRRVAEDAGKYATTSLTSLRSKNDTRADDLRRHARRAQVLLEDARLGGSAV